MVLLPREASHGSARVSTGVESGEEVEEAEGSDGEERGETRRIGVWRGAFIGGGCGGGRVRKRGTRRNVRLRGN